MSVIPDRIRWYDDMLVTPEHVERVSRRLERLLQSVPGRFSPFAWGVIPAAGDAAVGITIHGRTLSVTALEAVMPDGQYVSVTDANGLHLDLRPHLDLNQPDRLMVHLAAVPEAPAEAATRRFVSAVDPDGLVGDDGLPVERQRRQLVLFAGAAPAGAAFTSIPLIEIRQDGAAIAATDFVPPLLSVSPQHWLIARGRDVADRLRQEVAVVANRSMEDARMPFRADVRAQINPVLAALPPFEVLRDSRPHPFFLYLELCRLAGAVAGLRDHVAAPQVAAYNHEDLRATFEAVFRFILGDSQPTVTGRTVSFPFERDGRWFRLAPEPVWREALAAGSPLQVILAIEADATETLAARWGENCVIGSRSVMSSLLARRVLGLARRRVHLGSGVIRQRDAYLFQLDPDSDVVKPGEDLLVLGDLPNVTPHALTLHVIAPEPGRGDR